MYNEDMDVDTQPSKSKTSIFKREIKLRSFFKFLFISGSLFTIILLVFILVLGMATKILENEKDRATLIKEIDELKQNQNKQNELSTTSPQIQQQPVAPKVVVQDSDPIVNCRSVECGDRKVNLSVCTMMYCCLLNDDWVWASSQAECVDAQENEREREREKAEKESEIAEREADASECRFKATSNNLSCTFSCGNLISKDLDMYNKCMDDCESEYNSALRICD